ncbi:hypothetical protein [Candidatus Thiosymbion oneisti]|uniref:hypothetical protein n=1 Tax=Candidatus Thiosymbion oneisti TaxID=589554 RepID=UPI0015B60A32|nr:hypothetical protein [Candidatus Thiosymbion oneisti]
MSPNARKLLATLTSAGIMGMSLAYNPVSRAFDFGDMMNPGRWMGGNRDRNDDYYGGPYVGPWGSPYSGGPWRGPWGGYGPGPYSGGPYAVPRYRGAVPPRVPTTPTAKAPSTPVTSSPATSSSEIDALKRRIKALESQQQQQSSASPPNDRRAIPPSGDGSSGLTFRPMGSE